MSLDERVKVRTVGSLWKIKPTNQVHADPVSSINFFFDVPADDDVLRLADAVQGGVDGEGGPAVG